MIPSIRVHIMSPAGQLVKGGGSLCSSPEPGQVKVVGGSGTYFLNEATIVT